MYRIEILHISIANKLRSFNVQGEDALDALTEAAATLFGLPFVKADFNYEWLGDGLIGGAARYRVFHKRMDAFFGTFTVENLG